MDSLDHYISRREQDCAASKEDPEQEWHAVFIGKIAGDLDLERVVRVTWMRYLAAIDGDVHWYSCHRDGVCSESRWRSIEDTRMSREKVKNSLGCGFEHSLMQQQ